MTGAEIAVAGTHCQLPAVARGVSSGSARQFASSSLGDRLRAVAACVLPVLGFDGESGQR